MQLYMRGTATGTWLLVGLKMTSPYVETADFMCSPLLDLGLSISPLECGIRILEPLEGLKGPLFGHLGG